MRDDRERLLDILEAIENVEKYAARGQRAFVADELIQTWVVHHILIIGEACRGLSQDLKGRHPSVPWHEIVGMRNILIHRYFGVDTSVVWSVVTSDLPQLKQTAKAMLDAL
jgi:uncharacterized protein with HEPN domain